MISSSQVAKCVEEAIPLNSKHSTARGSCASGPVNSEAAQTPSYIANFSFTVEV